uniref:uncharacterized protein LOC124041258 isoform X1 n=1 Tax=Oncorhynchus gorbuscha TaxID=8017 RepID=UPI001EAEC3C6|nr:uncharacterized protein LOC124041258 isoform X1 [Oncorhynchus gorbuscha]
MSERGSFTKGDRDGVGQVEQLQQHLANFEPSSEQTEQQEEAQTGVESLRPVNDDTEAANEIAQQEPRKGERVRRLTEKGRELRDERWRQLEHRFRVSYEKWKALVKEAKLSLTGCCSEDLLEDLLNKISHTSTELNLVYVNLRQIDIPDNDIRRRVDTCEAVTMSIIKTVRCHLKGREEGQSNQIELHWKDSNSLCMSELSHKSSLNYQPSSASSQSQSNSKVNSRRSSVSSVKRQEAAAEVAANQAALEVMVKQERQLEELQRLEDEDKKRTAEQEAEAVKRSLEEARLRVKLEVENAARRRTLEDKRRELERLEVLKKLNAAKARMQVYEQDENSEDEKRELLSNCKSVKEVTHRRGSFHSLSPQHVVTSTQQEDGTKTMFRLLAESISESRLPIPEPVTFNGEPLSYTDWKVSFQTLIDRKNIPTTEKIYYLRKYVGGPAKKAIESYFMLGTESAYHAAWTILEERYGNKFFIAKSFRDKLNAWPTIGSKDSLELRDLVDFLRSCEAAMSQNKGLEVLNDCNENQKILAKLPDWLTSRWNRKVTDILEETEIFPSFSQFVKFLTREAKIACNPVTSLHALKPSEDGKLKTPRIQNPGARVLATNSDEKDTVTSCVFCEKSGHSLHKCWKFMDKPAAERQKFVQENKLCFGCLRPGHRSKDCDNRNTCDTCQRRHPSCLHEDRSKERLRDRKTEPPRDKGTRASSEAISNRVVRDINTHTSTIIPVWVSTTSEPDREVLVYALLDTQSDTTFILEETTKALNTRKEPVQLKLSTMASRNTTVPCQKLSGLQVRGFYLEKKIPLPTTYSREFIPANRDHIPTPETARAWSHLEHIAEEIAPQQSCDVGLLIGYNCSQALLPREIVSGKGNQPFAQRTDLGWSIVGYGNPCIDYGDPIGVSHRVIVRQVMPSLQSSSNLTNQVHHVCRTHVREVITTLDIIKTLESDFNERAAEEDLISQEDIRFLKKMKEGIRRKDNGHYEMPLPFKEERPNLPNNKTCAVHRLKCLERRLRRDKQYYKDYTAFMEETIACGDAEKVSKEEINKHPAWYIPHHGVYHPQKPGKIRVVFDCSAKFRETSLNDHLTGSEVTNTLLGVLCRFRKGPVAIMCDVECMFHQFHVKAEDQDYLRFLWWENGDLESQPSAYRMMVHLFGAASSPGCANYGLKHLAAEGQGSFSEKSIQFIERNFYVDDGLTSVSSEAEAAQLGKEARELCSIGKLRLHKFISNSKEVIATIPKEERAKGAKDLDMALGEPHMERALGVLWCVASDEFQFRVVVKERPLTRRGVLSTVASVYDLLGFVAPFVLVGKQILQRMCRDKIDWDDPLPDDLSSQWEFWLQGLQNLSEVRIQRSYLPSSFKEVQSYELHHFSDASTSGYGECSYLRTIKPPTQTEMESDRTEETQGLMTLSFCKMILHHATSGNWQRLQKCTRDRMAG